MTGDDAQVTQHDETRLQAEERGGSAHHRAQYGVGKTYARAREGTAGERRHRVVAAVVETPCARRTAELLEGIELRPAPTRLPMGSSFPELGRSRG